MECKKKHNCLPSGIKKLAEVISKKKPATDNSNKCERIQHHTKRHLKMMRKKMLAGSSFKAAHRAAQRKIGGGLDNGVIRRQRSLRSWTKQKWRTKWKEIKCYWRKIFAKCRYQSLITSGVCCYDKSKRRDKRKGKQFLNNLNVLLRKYVDLGLFSGVQNHPLLSYINAYISSVIRS